MIALEGNRILDLTHLPPGFLCTMVLADLGAEVIKIQAPPEVSKRGAGLRGAFKGEENRKDASFDALNRNKKSLGLNLKTDEGRHIFYQLVKTADVILEGFRLGTAKCWVRQNAGILSPLGE